MIRMAELRGAMPSYHRSHVGFEVRFRWKPDSTTGGNSEPRRHRQSHVTVLKAVGPNTSEACACELDRHSLLRFAN